MMTRKFAIASLLLLGSSVAAIAQPAPPPAGPRGAPPPLAAPAPPSPPPPPAAQLATTDGSALQGTVARLLPTPHGEVDGLLLEDGRLVQFPPHLSAALLAVVGQGDAVTIDGMAAGAGSNFRAWRITNRRTSQSVTDTPPPYPPTTRPWSERDMRVNGVIRRVLTGGRGEANGVILEEGTVVRFSPHVGEAFTALLVPGARLAAQGYGTNGPGGTAIEAVALGASESSLMSVGPGRPRP